MASKFNFEQALKDKGFKEIYYPEADYYNRCGYENVTAYELNLSKEIEVLWYGKTPIYLSVIVVMTDGLSWVEFSTGKCKEYTSPKRAYNAIIETVENAGFEF